MASVGGKENQIAFFKVVSGDPASGLKLTAGDAGQVKPVQPVTDHGQAATVEAAVLVGATPAVGDANEAADGFDQFPS